MDLDKNYASGKQIQQCGRKQTQLQKSISLLYTTNKHMKKEIIEILIHNNLKKYLEVNLINEMKYFFNENFSSREKEM